MHVLHGILSNGKRVCKSDEGLISAFKVFFLHILLTSSNFTSGGISSDFIWEERKLKKLGISK